jgi:hypothetical protein
VKKGRRTLRGMPVSAAHALSRFRISHANVRF